MTGAFVAHCRYYGGCEKRTKLGNHGLCKLQRTYEPGAPGTAQGRCLAFLVAWLHHANHEGCDAAKHFEVRRDKSEEFFNERKEIRLWLEDQKDDPVIVRALAMLERKPWTDKGEDIEPRFPP